MTKTPQRLPAPPAGAGEVERALALRDVMDHAVRVQREITAPSALGPSRWRRGVQAVIGLSALALAAWSWITKPAFVWGAPVEVAAARRVAETRVAMFLLAQRIEARREETGALPATLAEVGDSLDGVQYVVTEDTVFELRAASRRLALVYRSDRPPEEFLGSALSEIQRGSDGR